MNSFNPFKKAPNVLTRRSFVSHAALAGFGGCAASYMIRDLRLINSAMAANDTSGYKALVCVFMAGGNDANNWIVPTDATTFDAYTTIRGNLALPSASLKPLYSSGTTPYSDGDGHTYGFHPSGTNLQTLFNEDKLGVVFNVGTLVRPTTRAQYNSGLTAYRPPQLFSHSDQVTQWQTSIPDQPPSTGWGGRMADLLDTAANANGSISMSVSVAGANTFEVGNLVAQYQVSTSGAEVLTGNLMSGSSARVRAMKDILNVSATNLQRRAYSDVVKNAIAVGDALNTNISNTALDTFWTTAFPNTDIGRQLKMVARIIEARGNAVTPATGKFNMARQIFYVQLGGFDTHTSQVAVNGTDQPTNALGAHYSLLQQISDAIFSFQRAMEQLGVSNNVTTFTASDFSRTLPTNSQGSDHGWGSHHLVVGGAVKGGQTYGNLPVFAVNGPNDTGLGRWIPTLAVDQFAATLAKWFGLDASSLAAVFPNLGRFSTSDLGFML